MKKFTSFFLTLFFVTACASTSEFEKQLATDNVLDNSSYQSLYRKFSNDSSLKNKEIFYAKNGAYTIYIKNKKYWGEIHRSVGTHGRQFEVIDDAGSVYNSYSGNFPHEQNPKKELAKKKYPELALFLGDTTAKVQYTAQFSKKVNGNVVSKAIRKNILQKALYAGNTQNKKWAIQEIVKLPKQNARIHAVKVLSLASNTELRDSVKLYVNKAMNKRMAQRFVRIVKPEAKKILQEYLRSN